MGEKGTEFGGSGLLRVHVASAAAVAVVSLEGELDLSTVSHVDDALSLAIRENPPAVLVDLRGLTFMDSEGLRLLIEAEKQCRASGCRFVLVRGDRRAQRIFEIAGLAGLFEFVNDPLEVRSLGGEMMPDVREGRRSSLPRTSRGDQPILRGSDG